MGEIIITLPVNNTVKLASSGNSDWVMHDIPSSSLEPYLNRTDVVILTGQMNAQAMTYSNGAYHYAYNDTYSSSRNYYYLGGRIFISKLQISSKINTSLAGSRIQVFLYDYASDTQMFSFNRNGQPVDSDFVEFEKYPNVYADYLGIRFAADAIDLKDISIIITTASPSGGAGSGYIGNTLVSNKKMVGYNVPTSSAETTKTESIDEASESPVSGKPKIGNGYAKIKLIREYPTPPSNYLVDIEAEYGAFNLVTQYPLDRSYLTGVAVQNDYFYREDLIGSTVQSGFFIPYGNKLNITGKVVFETEALIGDEDRTATASPDFTMGFYSGFGYSTRIIEMTYRNHNFQSTSAWDYFYYYSNCPLGYPKAPMDYEEYYNRFTKIKFELVLESGVLKKLICYRDNVLYQEDDLNIDVSSIDMPYIKLSIPSANNRQPLTQKVKYFKVYTET